jgi:hypothetical protein
LPIIPSLSSSEFPRLPPIEHPALAANHWGRRRPSKELFEVDNLFAERKGGGVAKARARMKRHAADKLKPEPLERASMEAMRAQKRRAEGPASPSTVTAKGKKRAPGRPEKKEASRT